MTIEKSEPIGKEKDQDSEQYFRCTDQVSEAVWYWAAVASILVSATLFLMGKRDWSMFVGQWPSTFLLFGLSHRLIGTGRESVNALYQPGHFSRLIDREMACLQFHRTPLWLRS
jgi:hypothetical protein